MPWTAARAKNGVKVSLLPVACSNLAFIFSRSFTMRVTSTSKTPCTCALVRFDMIMCSAIFLRMTLHGHDFAGRNAADRLQRSRCHGRSRLQSRREAGADAGAEEP